jgi:hypothetical protein
MSATNHINPSHNDMSERAVSQSLFTILILHGVV